MQHGLVLAIEGSESQHQENRDSLVCIQGIFQAIFCLSGTSRNHDQTEIATVVCTSEPTVTKSDITANESSCQDQTPNCPHAGQNPLSSLPGASDEHACRLHYREYLRPQNQHCLHNACHTLTRRCREEEEGKKMIEKDRKE